MRYFLWIFYFFIFSPVFAVENVKIEFRRINQIEKYKEIWDLSISSEIDRIIILEGIIISRETGKIYECRTNKVMLKRGAQFLNYNTLPTVDYVFVRPDDPQILSEGTYDITVRILSFPSLQVITEETVMINKSDFSIVNDSTIKSKVSQAKFSLNANITGQYNYYPDEDTLNEFPNYYRVEASPSIELFGLPFTSDILVSSQNTDKTFRGSDILNFRFDYNRFMSGLMDKSIGKLQKVYLQDIYYNDSIVKKVYRDFMDEKYPFVSDYNKLLSNETILEQVQTYQELEQYKKNIKKDGVEKNVRNLKSDINKYSLKANELYSVFNQIKNIDFNQIEYLNELSGGEKGCVNIRQLREKLDVLDSASLKKLDIPRLNSDLKKIMDIDNRYKELGVNNLKNIQNAYSKIDKNELTRIFERYTEGDYLTKKAEEFSFDEVHEVRKKNKKYIFDYDRIERLSKVDLAQLESLMDSVGIASLSDNSSNIHNQIAKLYEQIKNEEIAMGTISKNGAVVLKNDIAYLNNVLRDEDPEMNWKSLKKRQSDFMKLPGDQIGKIRKANIAAKEKNLKTLSLDKKQLKKISKASDIIKKYENVDLNEMVRDPRSLKKLDDAFNLLGDKNKIFRSLKNLEIGTTVPIYSELSFNGVVVRGGYVRYENSRYSISATGGQLEKFMGMQRNDSSNYFSDYHKSKSLVTGFSGGWGEKNKKHIHLNYIYERPKSTVGFEKNKDWTHVTTIDLLYDFWNERIKVRGELAKSFSSDKGDTINHSNAAVGEIIFNLGKNRDDWVLSSVVNYIERDFYSPGVPFLLTDRVFIEIRGQKKINNHILSVFVNDDRITTGSQLRLYQQFRTYGATFSFQKTRWPYWVAGLNYIKSNQSFSLKEYYNNSNYNLYLNLGYDFLFSGNTLSTQIYYNNLYSNLHSQKNINNEAVSISYMDVIRDKTHQFSYHMALKSKRRVDFQFSYNMFIPVFSSDIVNRKSNVYEVNLNVNYMKKNRILLGGLYLNESKQRERYGFFVQNFINFNKLFSVNMYIYFQSTNSYVNEIDSGWKKMVQFRTMLNFNI